MKDRAFNLLHLSLTPIREPSFHTFKGTREDWLRKSLAERFTFLGRGGKELVWVPKAHTNELIFGLIQGKKAHSFHEPPIAGGAETIDEFWQGAYFFLDPRHHADGQKMAIENDVLGMPRALANSLLGHVNQLHDCPITATAELIFDESDFWRFSELSGGKLKHIKFRFVVPNMWGPQNDLEEDLKETGLETGSEKVEVVFRSSSGVRTDNEKVKAGVAYASRGAGSVEARNLEGKKFSSSKKPTVEYVPEPDLNGVTGEGLANLGQRVLGRG
jgi:hypothetical protein